MWCLLVLPRICLKTFFPAEQEDGRRVSENFSAFRKFVKESASSLPEVYTVFQKSDEVRGIVPRAGGRRGDVYIDKGQCGFPKVCLDCQNFCHVMEWWTRVTSLPPLPPIRRSRLTVAVCELTSMG